jgi:hypothetical protein
MKGPVMAISRPYLSTVEDGYLQWIEFRLVLVEDWEASALSAHHGKGRSSAPSGRGDKRESQSFAGPSIGGCK